MNDTWRSHNSQTIAFIATLQRFMDVKTWQSMSEGVSSADAARRLCSTGILPPLETYVALWVNVSA